MSTRTTVSGVSSYPCRLIATCKCSCVEYAVQIRPEDQHFIRSPIIHLCVPIANANLSTPTRILYRLTNYILPSMLEDMDTPVVISVATHFENEAAERELENEAAEREFELHFRSRGEGELGVVDVVHGICV